MCVNYKALSRKDMVDFFDVDVQLDVEWPQEAFQHYLAPIIRRDESAIANP